MAVVVVVAFVIVIDDSAVVVDDVFAVNVVAVVQRIKFGLTYLNAFPSSFSSALILVILTFSNSIE